MVVVVGDDVYELVCVEVCEVVGVVEGDEVIVVVSVLV